MSGIIVEVVAVEASSLTVDVIAPAPAALVVEVIAPPPAVAVVEVADWGTVPVSYPQLPLELQQLPLSFPVYGRPTVGTEVHVPITFPVRIPVGLAGTQTYAMTPGSQDRAFTLTAISSGVETEIGTVTFIAGSNTRNVLASPGARLASGDVLRVSAPTGQDLTLADLGITILTQRE